MHLKDREVLEKYRHRPFPHYKELKAILHCIESTMLGLPSQNEAPSPAVECHPATIQLPNQLPRSLSSNPFLHSDCTTSSAVTMPFFPATSESFPSSPQADHPFFPTSPGNSATHFPGPWSPNQKGGIDQHWAPDYPSAPYPSTSASAATQQTGPPLSAASFEADAVQYPALSLTPSATCHSTLSLPSGLQSIAMSSRVSSKHRHIYDVEIYNAQSASIKQLTPMSRASAKRRCTEKAAILGGQSSCRETTPMETVGKILDSVEILAKIIRQPPPPSPLTFCIMAATKATKALSSNSFLSDDQKVLLRRHFCRNPLEAASLPEDNALLDNIFRDMIKWPNML
jgi:hypothetical protein